MSVDPISHFYSELTPYQFASNRPIDGIDLDGLEYISAVVSKISVNINVIESEGRFALGLDVFVNSYKNVSVPTQNFLRKDGGSSHVATLESKNYEEISIEIEEKVATAFAQPKMEDVVDMPKSITQKEVYTKKIIKTSRIMRKTSPNASEIKVPSGVKTGSAKGSAILAVIQFGGELMLGLQGNMIKNDFKVAREQTDAATKVFGDIYVGLNNNVFPELEDRNNLDDYANYLLDGTNPKKMVTTGYNPETGAEIRQEVVDAVMVKKFKEYSKKIDEVKYGKPKSN